jgi:biopolymer transport protein ExbD
MGRRKNHRARQCVELNLAAMLDMAFQLLTFFILTFKPAPIEGTIDLIMPPAAAVTPTPSIRPIAARPASPSLLDPLADLRSLVIDVVATGEGSIGGLQAGGQTVGGLGQLDARLRVLLQDRRMPFDRVVIHAGSQLRYDALLSIVDVCTRQRLADGRPLGKVSFVEQTAAG